MNVSALLTSMFAKRDAVAATPAIGAPAPVDRALAEHQLHDMLSYFPNVVIAPEARELMLDELQLDHPLSVFHTLRCISHEQDHARQALARRQAAAAALRRARQAHGVTYSEIGRRTHVWGPRGKRMKSTLSMAERESIDRLRRGEHIGLRLV